MDGTSARAALGLPPDASRYDVKRAFRSLAKQSHPDRGGDRATFEHLTRAYDIACASAMVQPREHPFLIPRLAVTAWAAPIPRRPSRPSSFASELKRAMAR